MKITKFKSSLLTTTLISTSLFGSKPNPGTLRLPQETTQEVVQTIATEEVLPLYARRTMDMFNQLQEVKELKDKYDSLRQAQKNTRTNYGKTLAQKSHTNTPIVVRDKLNIHDTFDLRDEYEKIFKLKFNKVLKLANFKENDFEVLYIFIAPYVRYAFYEAIQYPVDRKLLSVLQNTSIKILQEYLDSFNIFLFCFDIHHLSSNPLIKMLQDCSIDLLKEYKDRTGDVFSYGTAYSLYFANRFDELKSFEQELIKNLEKRESTLSENSEQAQNFKKLLSMTKSLNHDIEKYKLTEKEQAIFDSTKKEVKMVSLKTQELEKLSKKTTKAKPQEPIKQTPLVGRKAAPDTFSIPETQKQMKQAPTPITLKDLDTKFGKDMEKDFDELEVITIDFESEKDWIGFVKENNVEISGTPYQHGSHESQEIFFDFEGQKTKGQLLTYHVHGKDTPEKITRQIRVTRRTQK